MSSPAATESSISLKSSCELRPVKDGIIRTTCSLCQNFCGALATVKDGRVIKLEGDPGNPRSHGHLCAKGLSGFLTLYSPKRITKPMVRTNPKKGLGVDPMWKEVSWDEAINIFAEKLKAVRQKQKQMPGGPVDVRNRLGGSSKILVMSFDHQNMHHGAAYTWLRALDAYAGMMGPMWCGNAIHPPSYLNTSTFETTPDAEYSKYILLIGSQAGSIIHYETMNVARDVADKRPRNIKVVAVDPVSSFAASRAEEWVPIRPGTDTAFIMGLVNLLVNEYKLYDAPFLKEKTNSPYLIGSDGHYVRGLSGKPQVWDDADGKAKNFDDPSVRDCALEGEHQLEGKSCMPAFESIKRYVKKYSPEFVSEVTTIPQETLRHIARELGEAACIGQTITVDGVEMPYRPVAVIWYRGLSSHRHAFLSGFAAMMLPTLLGAIQVPGGIVGHPPVPEEVDSDGLMVAKPALGAPYPPRPVKKPRRIDLYDLFPVAHTSYFMIAPVMLYPEAFGLKKEELDMPEIVVTWRDNLVRNGFAPEKVAEAFSKVPFMVAFNMEPDETMQLADVVFPEVHQLERLAENVFSRIAEPGFWYAGKPAVKPPFEAPWNEMVSVAQILMEVADRAGYLRDIYAVMNELWDLKGTRYELDLNKRYTYDDLMDRRLKAWIGPDHGLDWLLSDSGGLMVWGATPQERWKGAFRKGRVHLYYEFMLNAGKEVEKVTKELGLRWDTSDYQAIPDWKPCVPFTKRDKDYRFYAVNFKVPMMANGLGRFNPLVQQLVRSHGLDVALMNPLSAAGCGISEGDEVWIQTTKGRKGRCTVSLSERVHPEVVGTMQFKLDHGADFNSLVTLDPDTVDFLTSALDACQLVKIGKVSGDLGC